MRLIKVSAPEGTGADIAKVAFSVGIQEVSVQKGESLRESGESKTKDLVDIQTSTPKGKHFIDALLAADFYNQQDFSIAVRQPRSILSGESLRELTKPLVDPATDIFEELWQNSHITFGFVGRIFIAACLLAYGLIHQKTLTIIAALLFLPLLPLLLAVGFGSWTKQPKLAVQGLLAFLTATVLLILGGAAVAAFSSPPVKYDEFNSLLVTFLITAAVGIAAGLANIDDVGSRAMIGLAATAQIAIIPVWFGASFVLGFPVTTGESEITTRAVSFFVTILTIIVASLAVYVLSGAVSRSLGNVKTKG
ncbi:MAG: hypothetical protein LC768_00180 [Acidobacteria bacterium]|nr:hypothetical protein [Acidobacteriota bacterium]MCA1636754.1 hypothetical protein [Acidobacteriota bacterium]